MINIPITKIMNPAIKRVGSPSPSKTVPKEKAEIAETPQLQVQLQMH